MENNMPKKPGLFARLFGKSWEEAVQEIESIRTKLDKEKAALDQREAALVKRENEIAKKERELAKRRTELNQREAKVREQEKKFKRKEKAKGKIKQKDVEQLEIQTKPQVEVFVGPKVEELVGKEEYKAAPEIIEEPKAEAAPEVIEEAKAEETPEVIEEPKVEEKPEVVEEPKVEEKPEVVEKPKAEEKSAVIEKPKAEKDKKEVEPKAKTKPKKVVAQYSEEINEKRNNALLESLKELNQKIEEQLKLDDIQASTATTRTLESDNIVKKRRAANIATIHGYLFGLIAAYLDTLPEKDIKHIEIEGMTSTEFLRFLAADYEFEFQRKENNTKSLAIAKNESFTSKRFIYGAMRGYGRITKDVIEKEKYAAEVMESAKSWLIGSYLDVTLDETAPNMRKGIKIETKKIAKRDENFEKQFGEVGQIL